MRKAEWPQDISSILGDDDPLLFLTQEFRQAPIAEGACFMLTRANIEFVKRIFKGSGVGGTGRGAMVLDLTFKVTACGFGLACLGIPCKHLDRCWRTTAVPAAFGWGPKDDRATWAAILIGVFMFFQQMGVDLRSWISWVFWDGTAGGECAHHWFFEKGTRHLLDLPHIMRNCEKHADEETGKNLFLELKYTVHFLSAVPTLPLFSHYVKQFLAAAYYKTPESKMTRYATNEVFYQDGQRDHMWNAKWRCGVDSGLPPGITPDTVGNALVSAFPPFLFLCRESRTMPPIFI